ncbi:MAG TPA: hypothetical protein VGC88_09280 [Terriglobales bacterium]|jgi:hypothetical protein
MKMNKRASAPNVRPSSSPTEPAEESSEVWVHPNLSQLLKGEDHKLSTDEATQYWLDRQTRKPVR